MLRSQPNARIHAVATASVCVLGAYLRLSGLEWACLAVAATVVWSAEALNTAIELLGDAVSREHHAGVGRAKDVAAGAVLVCAIGAAIVGVVVLGPHLLALLAPKPNP